MDRHSNLCSCLRGEGSGYLYCLCRKLKFKLLLLYHRRFINSRVSSPNGQPSKYHEPSKSLLAVQAERDTPLSFSGRCREFQASSARARSPPPAVVVVDHNSYRQQNTTTNNSTMKITAFSLLSALASTHAVEHMNEIKIMEGHTKRSHVVSPLPHT